MNCVRCGGYDGNLSDANPQYRLCFVCANARVRELENKYEIERQTCNSGHTSLPAMLWDCPVCTDLLRVRVRELETAGRLLRDTASEPDCDPGFEERLIRALKQMNSALGDDDTSDEDGGKLANGG